MSKHRDTAKYHRGEAKAAFDAQGKRGISVGTHIELAQVAFDHERAAFAADKAFAAETGQRVDYTPMGTPVFTKR